MTPLFPNLLGARWPSVPIAIRALHGGAARVLARGRADIRGDANVRARALRACLRMPSPARDVPLEVEIEQTASGERWRRRFPDTVLESRLRRSPRWPDAFEERLGPACFAFAVDATGGRLRWIAREARLLAMPLPLSWFSGVAASCAEEAGRYRFDIDVRLPGVGCLVAYSGWLEIVDG